MGDRSGQQRDSNHPLLCFLKLQKTHGSGEIKIRAQAPNEFPVDKVNMAKKYCFPFHETKGVKYLPKKETFTFIMTDLTGAYNYGYCLLDNTTTTSSTVLCILSSLPWRKTFYEILRYLDTQPPSTQAQVLQKLKSSPIPTSAQPLTIVPNRIEMKPPDEVGLGRLSMMMIVSSMNPKLLIDVWISLLLERRIILTSTSLASLTDTAAALEELLLPFKWTGIYIMPLPEDMMDYASAPTPYIIGVHSSLYPNLLDKIGTSIVEDGICVLNIDEKAFYSQFKDSDLKLIPKKFIQELEKNLKNWTSFASSEIPNAFLTLQARLLEHYESGFEFVNDKASYSRDKFVLAHRDAGHRNFADTIIGVQMFEQFSQERLDEINSLSVKSTKFNDLDRRIANLEDLKMKMPDVKSIAQNSQQMFNKVFDKSKQKVVNITGPMTNRTPMKVVVAQELNFDSSPEEETGITRSERAKSIRPSRPPPPVAPPNLPPPKPERNQPPMQGSNSSLIDFGQIYISSSPVPNVPQESPRAQSFQRPSHDLAEFDPYA